MVPDAFRRLASRGALLAQRYTGFWRAADTFKDRVELDDMFTGRSAPWMVWDHGRHATIPFGLIPAPTPRADAVLLS